MFRYGTITGSLLLFLTFLFWSGATAAGAQTLAPAERLALFEEVWNRVDQLYYDPGFNGVDWQAVGRRYRPLAARTRRTDDLYRLLDRMVGELNDSHTRVLLPSGKTGGGAVRHQGDPGIALGRVEGTLAVTSVRRGSAAERIGMRPGMRVTAIGGRAAETLFAEALRKVGRSSSERSAEKRALSSLLRPSDGVGHLYIELEDGRGRRLRTALPLEPAPEDTSEPFARFAAGKILHLKLTSFDERTPGQVALLLRRHAEADGLILDLRGNVGGNGEAGLETAGYFLPGRRPVARLQTRTGKPPFEGIPMLLEAGREDGRMLFRGPLVILVDEGTASTAELITETLRRHLGAYIVGRRTCGCVLGFSGYRKLPGGGRLSVSEFGLIAVGERRLEGEGVAPDREIPLTLSDLLRDRDAALEAALEHLRKN